MKNKLLIIFILFVLIISFFTCSFASSETSLVYHSQKFDFDVKFNQNLSNFDYIISESTNGFNLYILVGDGNFYFKYSSGKKVLACSEGCRIVSHHTDYTREISVNNFFSKFDDNYFLNDIFDASAWLLIDFTKALNSSNEYSFFSSSDVYDTDGNLVFQVPQVDKVVIPAIQQVEEIPQVMGQAMKILIPIGLIVFSVGLVIYLMRLVISRVQ